MGKRGRGMTVKEAMDIRNNPTYEDVNNKELSQCIDDALEKQIPKKPDLLGDGYDDNGNLLYDTWICPCCETQYELYYDEYKFCPNCGQALDWSVEK